MAESRRKLKRILMKVNRGEDLDFSAVDFYRRRSNYPAGGMSAPDAIEIDRKQGMILNALVPSENFDTEAKANAYVQKPFTDELAKFFIIPNEVTFTPGDLDSVASTIQKTRKGVMVWFYFGADEWAREVPVILKQWLSPANQEVLRHSVVAVEPAVYKGIRGLWIDDSAHFGGLSRRFVSEAFYKARNFWASYSLNFKFEPGAGDKPVYTGTIVSLQDCLKWEGLFPKNVESTGFYGNVTTKAVKDFQIKYGLEPVGIVGQLTTAKLKELYPLP